MPTKLEAEHHFVKLVSSSRLKRRDDGTVYGVFPQAFELRPDENELSGSWLEFFDLPVANQIKQSAEATRSLLRVKRRDGFVVAQVEKIHLSCEKFDVRVRVLHEPTPSNPNPAYATIRNLPRDNFELLGLLADDAFGQIHVAGNILPDLP